MNIAGKVLAVLVFIYIGFGYCMEREESSVPQSKSLASYKIPARPHEAGVTALCMDPSEKFLFSGSHDGSIKVWRSNWSDKFAKRYNAFRALKKETSHLALLPPELLNEVLNFSLDDQKPLFKLFSTLYPEKSHAPITSLAVSSQGLLFSGHNNNLKIWQMTDPNDPKTFKCIQEFVDAHLFCVDSNDILFIAFDNHIRMLQKIETPENPLYYAYIEGGSTAEEIPITAICTDSKGLIFLGLEDGDIEIWAKASKEMPHPDGEEEGELFGLHTLSSHISIIRLLRIDSTGLLFSESADNGAIRVWRKTNPNDPRTYACIKILADTWYDQNAVTLGPDNTIFSGSGDLVENFINIWQRQIQSDPTTYYGVRIECGNYCSSVFYVNSSGLLIVGSDQGHITLWKKKEVSSAKMYDFLKRLQYYSGSSHWTACTECNDLVFLGYDSGAIALFQKTARKDLKAIQLLQTKGLNSIVSLHLFSDILFSVSSDKIVQIWVKKDPHNPKSYYCIGQLTTDVDLAVIAGSLMKFAQQVPAITHKPEPQEVTNQDETRKRKAPDTESQEKEK